MEKQQIAQARCKDITYGWIICVYCSEKKDPYRTRIMMGRNLVNYPDGCGTLTADLLTVKLMFNSIISTPNAKFTTIDIKDFYLMTPMDRYKYFRMNCSPRTSLMNMDSMTKQMQTATFSAKCNPGCTASLKPALLLKTSSPSASTRQGTNRARSHQDIGITIGTQSASPLLLTTLE
jgi:hypothetical protein